MLEIFIVIGLYRLLKGSLERKGRGTGLAWIGPLFWFGGEIAGAVFGGLMAAMKNQEGVVEAYIYALVGAVSGAVLSYIIVAIQPSGQARSYLCPSCGRSFGALPDALGGTTCPHCRAELQVSGGLVYEAGKKQSRYAPPPPRSGVREPDSRYAPPPGREAPESQPRYAPAPRRSVPFTVDEDRKTPFLLIAAIAICAIAVAAILVLGIFGDSLGLFTSETELAPGEQAKRPPEPDLAEDIPLPPPVKQPEQKETPPEPPEKPVETPEPQQETPAQREERERRQREQEKEVKKQREFEQWMETARMYLAENRYKDAARAAREAVKLMPEDKNARSILARAEAVIYVPDDFKTIQQAIDGAANGKTIVLRDGVYKGEGNRDVDFKGKKVTVRSERGPVTCIIDCEKSGRGFCFKRFETGKSVLQGFTIRNGSVSGEGGGIYFSGTCSPVIINCRIMGSTAGNGGAVSCWNGASPVMINCLIVGNSTKGMGGALNCWNNGSPQLVNCTLAGNKSAKCGGGVAASERSKPQLKNTIVWGNSVTEVNEETTQLKSGRYRKLQKRDVKGHDIFTYDSGSTVTLRNCCTGRNTYERNSYSGKGRLDGRYTIYKDPEFKSILTGDYSLNYGSPCIDRGKGEYVPQNVTTDLAGKRRTVGGRRKPTVDIGAYERQ